MFQMTNSKMGVLCALTIPLAVTIHHVITSYQHIAVIPRKSISEFDDIPSSLRTSRTAREHVNPGSHVALEDSRYTDIILLEDVTDEAVLAQYVRGFFGGRVFAPERGLLRTFRLDLVDYPSIKPKSEPPAIWSVTDIPTQRLLPLHSILFGAFQLADIHLSHDTSNKEESYVDFIFGTGTGHFAGVHRFSVSRPATDPTLLRIHYGHISCNPTVDKPLGPAFIQTLHKLYAMWLFRDGVTSVYTAFSR